MDEVVLNTGRRFGSVEHYHHFLLGFVVPLVLKMMENQNSNRRFLIRSCAILDRIIDELKFENLVISDKMHLLRKVKLGEIPVDTLYGYDMPRFYDRAAFAKVSSYLSRRLFDQIKFEKDHLKHAFDDNRKSELPTPRISLIDRGPPHEFYNSALAEVKTAGNQRRSVKNFDDLVSILNSNGLNASKFYLEDKPLSFQMALFQISDIVIAQHGAAFSNLIWAHDKLNVVEIIPSDAQKFFGDRQNIFVALSNCLGLRHFSVKQHGLHGPVDSPEILEVTNNICKSQVQRSAGNTTR